MTIRTMNIEDFEKIYDLWIHTEGMGSSNIYCEILIHALLLRTTDKS